MRRQLDEWALKKRVSQFAQGAHRCAPSKFAGLACNITVTFFRQGDGVGYSGTLNNNQSKFLGDKGDVADVYR